MCRPRLWVCIAVNYEDGRVSISTPDLARPELPVFRECPEKPPQPHQSLESVYFSPKALGRAAMGLCHVRECSRLLLDSQTSKSYSIATAHFTPFSVNVQSIGLSLCLLLFLRKMHSTLKCARLPFACSQLYKVKKKKLCTRKGKQKCSRI